MTLKPDNGERQLPARACVVTGHSGISKEVKHYLRDFQVAVLPRLEDLSTQPDCAVYILDTKVRDMAAWPSPLLLNPAAKSKLWLFLLEDASDAGKLRSLPPDSRFFDRAPQALKACAEFLEQRFDRDSGKRFAKVHYSPAGRSFAIEMLNGNVYLLPLKDIGTADGSRVKSVTVGRDRYYFKVLQESGNRFETPWDEVLYHCEPAYEHFKGRSNNADASNDEHAVRIGSRVRGARERAGLTVTDLAERSGMKRPNLSRLEHGRHLPSLETLERLADALGIPIAVLVAAA